MQVLGGTSTTQAPEADRVDNDLAGSADTLRTADGIAQYASL